MILDTEYRFLNHGLIMKTRIALALSLFSFSSAASAADLATRAPVYTKAPLYAPVSNWTGLYIGGNLGYGWGKSSIDTATLPTDNLGIRNTGLSSNVNGVLGGGQIGYNWQVNNVVFGLETDFQGSDIHGASQGGLTLLSGAPDPIPDDSRSLSQKLSWFGTVRGRLGVTLAPSFLLYGTGGLAYGQVDRTADTVFRTTEHDLASISTTRTGWAAGVGAEWMFTPGWSAKVEYLHIDLGGAVSAVGNNSVAPVDGVRYTFNDNRYDTVRFGVNYHFH